MIIEIIRTMGYKRGIDAVGLIRSAKKAGCKDIKLLNLEKDVLEFSCKHPNNGKLTNFKFDFAKDREYQMNDFAGMVFVPWDRKTKGTVKEISSLSTGRNLGTITHKITSDNGVVSSDETILQSYTSGNKFKRIVNLDGKIEYFKQNAHGQFEKMFG